MSEPVTTNPFIIMLINMTVVFFVLIILGLVIRFIHYIDPTVKKKDNVVKTPTPTSKPKPVAVKTEPSKEKGLNLEVVAAIAAAVAMVDSRYKIKAIRPLPREGWKNAGRFGHD